MSRMCDCILAGKNEVKYEGNLDAEIVFVGESPGYEELREGRPFVGRSGKLLKRALEMMGIPIEICFFANSARCMIEKDNLKAKEVKAILNSCRPNLETILHHILPKLIVPLGAIALEQVMKMKGIKKARGNFYWSEEFDCWVIPNWHPAYILRNASEEDNFVNVFRQIKEFRDSGYRVQEMDDFEYFEVDSIRALLDGGFARAADDSCYATALDTETQGLKWHSSEGVVISYSVAASDKIGYNIVLHEECDPGTGDFDIMIERGGTKKLPELAIVGVKKADNFDAKFAELKELCERKDIQKYFMNQKYDMHWLEHLGIEVINRAPLDIALAAHVIDAPRYMNASLGYLLESFCGISGSYKDDFSEAEKMDMLHQLATQRDKFNRYAAYDAVSTFRVALKIIDEFNIDRTSLNYYVNFAHPVETKFLYEMESNGVLIDEDSLPMVSVEIDEKIEDKVSEFKELCPEEVKERHVGNFKLTRKAILMDALFQYSDTDGEFQNIGHGIEPKEFSPKSKLPKVSKDILKVLLDDSKVPNKAKQLIDAYQTWSSYHTLKSRYIKQIEDCVAMDGRIYPTYSLTYTSSGRTGARKPSVQNFPKRFEAAHLIRKLIIASPGKVLMETDHSMSELRWTAEIANEERMKEIFLKDGDIHLFTGAALAEYPLDIASKPEMVRQLIEKYDLEKGEVKPLRQNAKAVNFGLIYKMSAMGLRNYAYQGFGVKLTDRQSNEWRKEFFRLYPGITPWQDGALRMMEEKGQITTIFGRRIPVPNIYSDDKKTQAEAERFGVNALVQGPSSDYTLLGGLETTENEEYNRNECKAALFIHDAIVWEVDVDKVDKYAWMVKRGMEQVDTSKFGFKLSIPFVANAEVGFSLADTEEYKFEEVVNNGRRSDQN